MVESKFMRAHYVRPWLRGASALFLIGAGTLVCLGGLWIAARIDLSALLLMIPGAAMAGIGGYILGDLEAP